MACFIAADGTDCVFGESCTEKTGKVVSMTHEKMKQNDLILPDCEWLLFAPFAAMLFIRQVRSLNEYLIKTRYSEK
jgi:hypothetical protein